MKALIERPTKYQVSRGAAWEVRLRATEPKETTETLRKATARVLRQVKKVDPKAHKWQERVITSLNAVALEVLLDNKFPEYRRVTKVPTAAQ